MRGLKQAVIAEFARVSQATVSRWESGELELAPELAERLLAFVGGSSGVRLDSGLRRLVENAVLPVHLITDHDHRLLGASWPRQREWRRSAAELDGLPLWRFATGPIEAAEARLGWWEQIAPAPVSLDAGGGDSGLPIMAGAMIWERLYLSDGTPVRLCTSPGVRGSA